MFFGKLHLPNCGLVNFGILKLAKLFCHLIIVNALIDNHFQRVNLWVVLQVRLDVERELFDFFCNKKLNFTVDFLQFQFNLFVFNRAKLTLRLWKLFFDVLRHRFRLVFLLFSICCFNFLLETLIKEHFAISLFFSLSVDLYLLF